MITHGPITKPVGLSFYTAMLGADEDFWIEKAEPECLPQDPVEVESSTTHVVTNLWDAVRRPQEKRGETRTMEPQA